MAATTNSILTQKQVSAVDGQPVSSKCTYRIQSNF